MRNYPRLVFGAQNHVQHPGRRAVRGKDLAGEYSLERRFI
jgi:hypothetical protein